MQFFELAMQHELVLFVTAGISSLFFFLSLVLMLVGGSSGYEIDAGSEGALDWGSEAETNWPDVITSADLPEKSHLDATSAFKLFSLQSILAFLMGFGWTGLAARIDWSLSYLLALPLAFAVGFTFMVITAWLFSQVFRLNHIVRRDILSLIGKSGKAYTALESGRTGQIQIEYHKSLQTLPALTEGESIEAFDEVEVIGIKKENKQLIVRKKNQ